MMNSTAHPIRILMVDDEPLIAQLVVDVLTTEGYEVDTAASGLLALDRIKEGSYDLILSDLRMPDLDGFAFYHELERRRPELVRRMIFISGTTEHPEYQRLGTSDEARRTAFRSLCAESLQERVVEQIRAAINTDSALGSEKFMAYAEEQLGRSVRPPLRGRPPKVVTGKLL